MSNTVMMDVVLLFLFSVLALSPTFTKTERSRVHQQTPQEKEVKVRFDSHGKAVRFVLERRQLLLGVHAGGAFSLDGAPVESRQALGAALGGGYKNGLFDEVVVAIDPEARGGDVVAAITSVVEAGCSAVGFREIGGGNDER